MKGTQEQEITEVARTQGMITLREAAINKAVAGVTTIDEVFRVTVGDQDVGLA
jgi:type II secretory ATPase GspE/PulE/Tfp pilus assembly ATPase PilB-like protein